MIANINKFSLPENVEFCTKCVISNQRPSTVIELKHKQRSAKPTIKFKNGICNACLYHEKKYNQIDWGKREAELIKLCDKHRSKDGSYDVIVPGSGGKDSIYVAHILKTKYGMNPLTVTWSPNMYTDIGYKNFKNWLASGFDNVFIKPDFDTHRILTRLAFLNLLHPFQPFMIGQKNVAPKLAIDKNIKLIMYGESQAEGGSHLSEDNPMMPVDFFAKDKEDIKKINLGGVEYSDLKKYGIKEKNLEHYLPVSKDKVDKKGIEVHFMSYYKLWIPQNNYYYSVENCGFSPNPERSEGTYSKYSSLDDKIDGFHYFTTYIKFGIGRASYDAAQEIRNSFIDRDEGIALVKKYDGEFPEKYFNEFLEYIDIDKNKFWNTIDSYRSPHLWKKIANEWKLKHTVYK